MTRRVRWELKCGYAVLSIPGNGLFCRGGELKTGGGVPVVANEMILFSRRLDAEHYAASQAARWAGREWSFPVIPVLVSERT